MTHTNTMRTYTHKRTPHACKSQHATRRRARSLPMPITIHDQRKKKNKNQQQQPKSLDGRCAWIIKWFSVARTFVYFMRQSLVTHKRYIVYIIWNKFKWLIVKCNLSPLFSVVYYWCAGRARVIFLSLRLVARFSFAHFQGHPIFLARTIIE